jgi:adenylate cyclase
MPSMTNAPKRSGKLNKTIGDAIMAVFNFPIRRDDHAEQAARAARWMQQGWRARHSGLVEGLGLDEGSLCIGISSGDVS